MKYPAILLAAFVAFLSAYFLWSGHIQDYPVQEFETPAGGTLKVALISHGSIAFKYKGYVIQIDPVAGEKADYSKFGKADAIFITHEHGDHFDVPTIKSLSKKTTEVYLNRASQEKLGYGHILCEGTHIEITDAISVKAGLAYNISEDRVKFHPKGNGNGYLFNFDGFTVYVSGDTEKIPEMIDIHEPDIAFLAANQPYTMTVDQCVQSALLINPKVLYPYHLGDTDMAEIKRLISESGSLIDVRIFEQLR